MELRGIGASEGAAWGKAVVFRHQRAAEQAADKGETPAEALEKFRRGRLRIHEELLAMAAEAEQKYGPDKAGIFEGYAEIIMDDEIEELAAAFIREGVPAAQAARKALEQQARELAALDSAYLRDRGEDLEDMGRRLETAVAGEGPLSLPDLAEPCVLVADELSPFETVRLDHRRILALALDRGGYTGHVAILARSLGIPCAAALGNASALVETGTVCAVDGDLGLFTVNPGEETLEALRRKEDGRKRRLSAQAEKAGEPARTLDGFTVPVCANIGSPEEGAEAAERGADGVGLFRTEFLYMDALRLPPEEEQFERYRTAAEALGGRPLTIRTLDIGGDKEHPALGLEKEENPFLGYRAIRVGLDRPDILKPQLRAVLRAAARGRVELMFPLVIAVEEFRRARALLEECRGELEAEGEPAGKVPTGIMVETPAAAVMAREFAAEADFFSIGTNDLTQYTLAADRGNSRVAGLYDPLNPAVLRLLALACDAGEEAGIPVGLCGELAGDPRVLPLLIGLGVTKLSVSPSRIPAVKEGIRGLDRGKCRELARRALALVDTAAVYALLVP